MLPSPHEEQEVLQHGLYWFVGASYGGRDDQAGRFLTEGIWDSGTPLMFDCEGSHRGPASNFVQQTDDFGTPTLG